MKKFLAPVALMLALFTGASAQAQTNLSLVGDFNFTSFDSNGGSTDRTLAVGGGALLEFQSSPSFGLEIGALYNPRAQGDAVKYTANTVQVPVALRFHLSNYVSLGVGGYYASYLQNRGYGSSSDYGALGSLGIYIPVGASTRFIIDGRYIYGLKDQNQGAGETKSRDVQVLAGLRFGF
jgi:hypothetical protein